MGKYYWSKKTEADDLKKVSVFFLKKEGYFIPGQHAGNITWSRNSEATGSISVRSLVSENEEYIRFLYTQTNRDTGDAHDFGYKVQLATTPCNYGGTRYWFVCPLSTNGVCCGRRVGILYKNGDYFGCRHCHNLSYACRNLSGFFKTAGKTISIPDLERMEEKIKRKHYAGMMTKKYRRWIEQYRKSVAQVQFVTAHLYNDLY